MGKRLGFADRIGQNKNDRIEAEERGEEKTSEFGAERDRRTINPTEPGIILTLTTDPKP